MLENVGGKISLEMQTPKLLWIKNKLPKIWSKAANFFDLSDFLTWKATGGSKVRSLCSTVCKWTFEGLLKTWNETYFRQIGLGDLADENFERIGSDILRLVLSLIGEEKCVVRKFFEFILAGVGLVRKKSKFSSSGPISSRQNVQILPKMYKFLTKMCKFLAMARKMSL